MTTDSATRAHDGEAEPSRAAVLVPPVLQLCAVLVAAAYLLNELSRLEPSKCLQGPSTTPGLSFVGVGIVGLLVGRYSGALRFYSRTTDPRDGARDPASVLIGRIALTVIFLALVPVFLYEAVGVYQPPNGFEPITYYVRCSIWFDNTFGAGIASKAVILGVCFLFGRWLWSWHPTRAGAGGPGERIRRLLKEIADMDLSRPPSREADGAGAERR